MPRSKSSASANVSCGLSCGSSLHAGYVAASTSALTQAHNQRRWLGTTRLGPARCDRGSEPRRAGCLRCAPWPSGWSLVFVLGMAWSIVRACEFWARTRMAFRKLVAPHGCRSKCPRPVAECRPQWRPRYGDGGARTGLETAAGEELRVHELAGAHLGRQAWAECSSVALRRYPRCRAAPFEHDAVVENFLSAARMAIWIVGRSIVAPVQRRPETQSPLRNRCELGPAVRVESARAPGLTHYRVGSDARGRSEADPTAVLGGPLMGKAVVVLQAAGRRSPSRAVRSASAGGSIFLS